MLRRLSSFLADASLALTASDSIQEMLQLVAEQARELTGANCCFAAVTLPSRQGTIAAASYSETDVRWAPFLESTFVSTMGPLARPPGGFVRPGRPPVADHPAGRSLTAGPNPVGSIRGWLAAPLTALDGRELGSIHVIDKDGADFSELDEAVLVHLAQMASAAVERAQLYEERR